MCNNSEHWVIYPDDQRYSVSDLGRIKNNKTGRITKGCVHYSNNLPYYRFKLGKNGKFIGAHNMVLTSFVPRPEGCVCDHINHNTLDNRLENLHWVSIRDNTMNSDYREFYGFKDNKYFKTFKGWDEAADFLGVNKDYLRKRCNGCKNFRYKDKTVNGYYFLSVKKYRKISGYRRFIILDCD